MENLKNSQRQTMPAARVDAAWRCLKKKKKQRGNYKEIDGGPRTGGSNRGMAGVSVTGTTASKR